MNPDGHTARMLSQGSCLYRASVASPDLAKRTPVMLRADNQMSAAKKYCEFGRPKGRWLLQLVDDARREIERWAFDEDARVVVSVAAVRVGLLSDFCPATRCAADAEGIVARPAVELVNRYGERVITKLKTKDFS